MRERRSLIYPVHRRGAGEEPVTLSSTAPPWNTLSVDLGGFRERFARGAFDLDVDVDVISTFEHRSELLLGRTPKTLELHDTEDGLEYRVTLPATQLGRDLTELVDRGDLRGSSFEFSVRPEGEVWTDDEDGNPIRTITSAELYQVGPVTSPAYRDGTSVALRHLEQWRKLPDKAREQRLAGYKRRVLEMRAASLRF